MSGHGKHRNGTGRHFFTTVGGLLAGLGLGVALALGVAALSVLDGLTPAAQACCPRPPAAVNRETSGRSMQPRVVRPPNTRPNRPPNMRDAAMAGRNRPDGKDGVTLTEAEKEALEIDELLDELIWAIDPAQAAARSILDEYLEAAARPENADKSPDDLMEQATATVMERLFPIDEDTKNERRDPTDYDSPTNESAIKNARTTATGIIVSDMRQGESPVLAGRPGGMSRQEWDAYVEKKEKIYQGKYDKKIKTKETPRPEIRPLREANGDRYVVAARAAAAGLSPEGLTSNADGGSRSKDEHAYTLKDPFGNRSRVLHSTRDTEVIIVTEGRREIGVKVEFKGRGNYGGQQPVVYGADPTVPEKMIYHNWWADSFNTNEVRLFGGIRK